MQSDYYEVLGVSKTASDDEVRAAYRRAVKAVHPDAGGTSALFRLVQDAGETLTDAARRAAYDAERNKPPEPEPQPAPPPPPTDEWVVEDVQVVEDRPAPRPAPPPQWARRPVVQTASRRPIISPAVWLLGWPGIGVAWFLALLVASNVMPEQEQKGAGTYFIVAGAAAGAVWLIIGFVSALRCYTAPRPPRNRPYGAQWVTAPWVLATDGHYWDTWQVVLLVLGSVADLYTAGVRTGQLVEVHGLARIGIAIGVFVGLWAGFVLSQLVTARLSPQKRWVWCLWALQWSIGIGMAVTGGVALWTAVIFGWRRHSERLAPPS